MRQRALSSSIALLWLAALPTLLIACGEEGTPAEGALDAVVADAGTGGLVDSGGLSCAGRADGTPCDDGDPCSANDRCAGDLCAAGQNVCACSESADCAAYEDNNACNGTLYCDKNVFPYRCLVKANSIVTCGDTSDPCTVARCDPSSGACETVPGNDGGLCVDADPCSVASACSEGECVGGEASWCACSKDADCAAGSAKNLCDGALYCDTDVFPHTCRVNPSSVVQCPSAKDTACAKNACDPASGVCASEPVETLVWVCSDGGLCRWQPRPKGVALAVIACDDGNPCSQNEACAAGTCKGGLDVCKCEKDSDCDQQEDGDLCNGTLYCDVATGSCAVNPKTIVTCPSASDTTCTENTCNPLTGTCALTPVKPGKPCDDGDACTSGEICKGGVCAAGAVLCQCKTDGDCVAKDDGDLCNGTLFCQASTGKCLPNPGSVVTCPSVNDTDCLKNVCAPTTGKCGFLPAKSGDPCSDGSACTVGDWCLNGECKSGANTCECTLDKDCAKKDDGDLCNGVWYCDKSGTLPECKPNAASKVWCAKDGDSACLKNVCDAKTGACGMQPLKDGSGCPPSGPCVKTAACSEGVCAVVAKLDCNDKNPCTVDTCDDKVGCSNKLVACDDGNPCTLDVCDSETGACSSKAAPMQGKGCDADGNGCTINDFCNAGKCVSGVSVLCPKATSACAVGQCVSLSGTSHKCVVVPSKEGSPCVGDHPCLLGSTCKAGTCVAGKQEKLFRQTRGLADHDVRFAAVRAVPAGGYVAVGSATPTGSKAGAGASWIVDRRHATGASMTAKPLLLSSEQPDVAAGAADVQVAGAGVIVAGTVKTKLHGQQVRVLALAADTKTVAWDRLHGGAGDERAHALSPLPGGGWVIAGERGSATAPDGLALRLSTTGLLLASWSDAVPGVEVLRSGVGMSDGGALLAGWRKDATGKQRGWLLRLDGGWKPLWSHAIGDAAAQALTAVARVGASTIAAGWQGAPTPHAWWLSLDALGKTRWQQSTTLPSEAWSITGLGGGRFALGGRMVAKVGSGWLAGVDATGHLVWQRELNDGGEERIARVSGAADGGLIAAGAVSTKAATQGLLVRADPWGHSTCASSGVCAGKSAAGCDDNKICTDDLCDAKQGCTPAHNAIACDDGDACSTADACQAGACVAGGKTSCDDANACTTDACDSKKGCVHTANPAASCADGSVCTSDEKCVGGVCQLTQKDCDDGVVCTVDACDAKKGCLHQAKPDETPCGGDKVCLLGTCTKRWAVAMAVGAGFTIAVGPDGAVRSWGYYAYGVLGRPGNATAPGKLPNLPPATHVTTGSFASCAITTAGQIYCWGSGPLGIGCSTPSQSVAVPVVKWTDTAVGLTAAGGAHICGLTDKGLVRCWGSNAWGACGTGTVGGTICTPGASVVGITNAVQVVGGAAHTCARLATGKVQCWGGGTASVLGDGKPGGYGHKTATPQDVLGLADAIDVASGTHHVCAVRKGGAVVCWGRNNVGQLGDGSLSSRSKPSPVFGLKDAIDVEAAPTHTCALRKNGQVACWGGNSHGQLGTGNTFKSIAPLPVKGLDGVIAVGVGNTHSCALRKNGELRCWGSNGFGELGTGTKGGTSTTPVPVKGSVP